jgi:uncharacterized Zn-binding protein involved in type VI secretion
LILGLALSGLGAVSGAEKTWNANAVGDWSNPDNWSPPGVPTATDTIRINDGELMLSGAPVIKGHLAWSGGKLQGGELTIAPEGTAELLGEADKVLVQCTLNNDGHVTWLGGGRIIGQFTGYG